MRIIVTGGAGFIGSALVRYLVQEKACSVLTIDKLTYAGNLANLAKLDGNSLHSFLKADICDSAAIDQAIQQFRPDRIYHLAAESHVDRSIDSAGAFINTNVLGTFTLLEAARRFWSVLEDDAKSHFRFLHVSTDEVYGSLGHDGLFSETTAYNPSSPYSASKAASDHLVIAWGRTYGLPVLISNCSNNYGPYHFPEKLIPLVILNALHGKSLPVYGDGNNIRDWLYVDDHARALHLIGDKGRPGQSYNVGGHNERRNIDIVREICTILDEIRPKPTSYTEQITFVSDRPGHDARYAIDSTKIRLELGWKAEETFESGIRKTINWYLENESWWRPLRDKVYAGERLGTSIEKPQNAYMNGGAA